MRKPKYMQERPVPEMRVVTADSCGCQSMFADQCQNAGYKADDTYVVCQCPCHLHPIPVKKERAA